MLHSENEPSQNASKAEELEEDEDRNVCYELGATGIRSMESLVDTTSNVALVFSTPSITIGHSSNNKPTTSILRPALSVLKRLHSSSSVDEDQDELSREPLLARRMSSLNVETAANEETVRPKGTVRFDKNCISRSISTGGYSNDYEGQFSPTLKNQAMSRRASLFVRRISMAIPSLSGDPIPQSVSVDDLQRSLGENLTRKLI